MAQKYKDKWKRQACKALEQKVLALCAKDNLVRKSVIREFRKVYPTTTKYRSVKEYIAYARSTHHGGSLNCLRRLYRRVLTVKDDDVLPPKNIICLLDYIF